MTRNQLPEGVGKKIVEALKRQNEADITPVSEVNNTLNFDTQNLSNNNSEQTTKETDLNESLIVEEEIPDLLPQGVYQEKPQPIVENINIQTPEPTINLATAQAQINERLQKAAAVNVAQINIPANVAILKNLIASLPAGVSKQTGAQIIRQTLEAMGLPMNSVLKEAQELQEDLNNSTRECMLKIQEYKTNILQLEQSVQDYQKNITQINDLVSLFLMTDRK